MSLTLQDSIAGDFANAVDTTSGFGQTVTITANDATKTVYTPVAIVTAEETKRRESDEGTRLVHVRRVMVPSGLSADFDAATSRAMGMTHLISGLKYATENFTRCEVSGVMTFHIARESTNEKTRRGYRKR